jgi:hypothetical protein
MPHTALSPPFEAFAIDMQRAADEFVAQSQAGGGSMKGGCDDMSWQQSLFVDWVGSVDVTATGTVDAVVYWFDLELTPGVHHGPDKSSHGHELPIKLSTGAR